MPTTQMTGVHRLSDGSYLRVGIEHRSFTINPFRLRPTKENLHFLFSFVKVLIESGGYAMTSKESATFLSRSASVPL